MSEEKPTIISYDERIEKLKQRGINTDNLLSDWCVSCSYSYRIQEHIVDLPNGDKLKLGPDCGTGCNGIVPFGVGEHRTFLEDKYQTRIKPVTSRNEKGDIIVENIPVPIMYEEEEGVES